MHSPLALLGERSPKNLTFFAQIFSNRKRPIVPLLSDAQLHNSNKMTITAPDFLHRK